LGAAFTPVHVAIARRILALDPGLTDATAQRAARAVLDPPRPRPMAQR
jgi:hypothetical protein